MKHKKIIRKCREKEQQLKNKLDNLYNNDNIKWASSASKPEGLKRIVCAKAIILCSSF
jgi:hypothetical protein